MKKIVLFGILMCIVTSFAIASEVSFFYTSQSHQRYWHYTDNGIRLDWYKNNYGVDLNLTPLLQQKSMTVNEAWIKFGKEKLGVKLGMMWYPFGNIEHLPSKSISILQSPQNKYSTIMNSAIMVNFCGKLGNIGWQAYWADAGFINWKQPWDKPSYVGARFTYEQENLKLGASVRGRNLLTDIHLFNDDTYDDEGKIIEAGVDICWKNDLMKLDFQAFRYDPKINHVKDIDYAFFTIASYEKGFILPVFNHTRPYVGFFSKDNSKTGDFGYNIIVGLNMKPMESVFIKLEYNHDSFKGWGDTITLQSGYVF